MATLDGHTPDDQPVATPSSDHITNNADAKTTPEAGTLASTIPAIEPEHDTLGKAASAEVCAFANAPPTSRVD